MVLVSTHKTWPFALSAFFIAQLLCMARADVHFYDFILKETKVTKLCAMKSIMTVNDGFPGPTIKVHKGDTVYVNVRNQGDYGVTLHCQDGNISVLTSKTYRSNYVPELLYDSMTADTHSSPFSVDVTCVYSTHRTHHTARGHQPTRLGTTLHESRKIRRLKYTRRVQTWCSHSDPPLVRSDRKTLRMSAVRMHPYVMSPGPKIKNLCSSANHCQLIWGAITFFSTIILGKMQAT